MGKKVSAIAGWIIQGILFSLLMSTYYFYLRPNNVLQGLMAFIFCFVTAWLGKKVLEFMLRRG